MFVVLAGAVGRTAPAETAAASLSEFFAPGIVFQDRNSDGAVDFVDARLVLGEQPSSAEVAAVTRAPSTTKCSSDRLRPGGNVSVFT